MTLVGEEETADQALPTTFVSANEDPEKQQSREGELDLPEIRVSSESLRPEFVQFPGAPNASDSLGGTTSAFLEQTQEQKTQHLISWPGAYTPQ